jgi:CSLREA domain-containing protein
MRSWMQTFLARVTGALTAPLYRFSKATALALGVLASPLQAITVTVTYDAVDADLGDGLCGDAAGECTLRAAIQHANTDPDLDIIVLPPGHYLLTIPGEDENAAAEGDLDVTESVALVGLPDGSTTIDANGLDRVIEIFGGATAAIIDLTLTGGGAGPSGGSPGGGIVVSGGGLDLRKSRVMGNSGQDAGVLAIQSTSFAIEDSVIADNYSVTEGNVLRSGGVYVSNPQGEVSIQRSTIASNACGPGTAACKTGVQFTDCGSWVPQLENVTIAENAGGVFTLGCSLSITNATLVGSTEDPALHFNVTGGSEQLAVTNTIIAHNYRDCLSDRSIAGGANLDTDNTCGLDELAGDKPATDPLLSPLGLYPTATPVFHPKVGSPVIDGGSLTGCSSEDQHGYTRPQNGDGQAGFECDIGSVEVLRCDEVDLLEIADQVPLAPGSYEACATISAVRSEVAAGTAVNFEARDAIVLGEGFRVASGGSFSALLTRRAGSGL